MHGHTILKYSMFNDNAMGLVFHRSRTQPGAHKISRAVCTVGYSLSVKRCVSEAHISHHLASS